MPSIKMLKRMEKRTKWTVYRSENCSIWTMCWEGRNIFHYSLLCSVLYTKEWASEEESLVRTTWSYGTSSVLLSCNSKHCNSQSSQRKLHLKKETDRVRLIYRIWNLQQYSDWIPRFQYDNLIIYPFSDMPKKKYFQTH